MLAQYNTQIKVRRMDENGDMIFGSTAPDAFLEGTEALAQVLSTRLKAIQGEWWEGDEGALPWMTDILGSMVSRGHRDEIDLMVIDRIMDTVCVNSVDNISSEITNRHYKFSCTAHTVHGDVPVEVTL